MGGVVPVATAVTILPRENHFIPHDLEIPMGLCRR